MALAIFDASIEVLFVLTDDHYIHIGVFGINKRVVGHARADIGVQPKSCACGDIEALVASTLWRSDRCLEKNLGTPQRFPCAGLDTRVNAAQINLLAYLDLFDCNTRSRLFNNMQRSIHNFRANTIPTSNRNWCIFCHRTIFPASKQTE